MGIATATSYLPPELLGNRALRGEMFAGGTVTMLVNILEYKNYLLSDNEIKLKMLDIFDSHESYRR